MPKSLNRIISTIFIDWSRHSPIEITNHNLFEASHHAGKLTPQHTCGKVFPAILNMI